MQYKEVAGGICAPKGFAAAGVHCGIRANHSEKYDLALIKAEVRCAAAGVYTTNKVCGAPIKVDRAHLADGYAQAIVVNSGNANTCAANGVALAEECCALVGKALNIDEKDVLPASTGVIGQPMVIDPFARGIPAAAEKLAATAQGSTDAATAIMTTDTKPKTVELTGSNGWKIGGMVKGSGMIAPQLATMLCVITTDAVVSAGQMQAALAVAAEHSFNRIDVDGCMSTNDTVLLLASGASGIEPDKDEFNKLVREACASLSRQIIGDGEGASHDIRITVTGATSEDAALACGRAVAASNLLKCAISGNDPNWGRIVSSLGTVPPEVAPYDSNKVTVDVNGVRICENGGAGRDRSEVDMTPREVHIDIDLNTGSSAQATVWTDDLTHEYVHINADYES